MKLFGSSEKTITISTETIVKTILLTVTAFLLLGFIGQVTHQLRLIAISAFLALALNPAVNWLMRKFKSKSRPRAVGVAYLAVLTVLIGFLLLVVPPLVSQSTDFIQELPQTISDFQTQDSAVANFVRRYNLDEQLDKLSKDLSSRTGDLASPLLNTASRAVGTLVSMITVLVLTFMMLMEGPLWFERFIALQPESKRLRRRKIAARMYKVVTGYVNGQVLIAAIAATFALIVLLIGNTVFNTSVNAVALAGITFMFGLIPLIGNTLGAAIVVLMCLFTSTGLAVMMAIYYLVYQQIENATLQPYIQSKSNQLTPLTVFAAALLGAGLGGLLGALAAIPIAGCIRILLEDYLDKPLPSKAAVDET